MPHILTDLDPAAFDENTVNAAPQLLDADVTVTDSVNGWTGGTLTVTGLLAEDTVGVQTGAQIYLDGASVMYDADGAGAGAAVSIGTASGGAGGTFTVTFNAAATRAGIEALIETLTYAAASNLTTLNVDLDGDGVADYRIILTGDHRTTSNLYTGGGDMDGGWVL